MSEKIEIELRYFNQTSVSTGRWLIVDSVLLLEKIMPAWEFRSNFVKSKNIGSGTERRLDLYYTAKVPMENYMCRFERNDSTPSEKTKKFVYFITTKKCTTPIKEIPKDVREAFEKEYEMLGITSPTF